MTRMVFCCFGEIFKDEEVILQQMGLEAAEGRDQSFYFEDLQGEHGGFLLFDMPVRFRCHST